MTPRGLGSGAGLLLAGCLDWKLHAAGDSGECPGEPTTGYGIPRADCLLFGSPTEVADPWAVRRGWSYPSPSDGSTSAITPLVGWLRDTDGDGVLAEGDTPVVVAAITSPENVGRVVALDGATGEELWRFEPVHAVAGGIALGDVDEDGSPEVLAVESDLHVVALRADGTLLWRSEAVLDQFATTLALGHLGLDDHPSLVAHRTVLDARNGTERLRLDGSTWFAMPTIADLDLDGVAEILVGPWVYAPDGSLLWQNASFDENDYVFSLVVQLDGDPEGEVAMIGDLVTFYDHDGTRLDRKDVVHPRTFGASCAGDLDGDGAAELAWPAQTRLIAVELDGTRLWEAPVHDGSMLAGCTTFDLDGDGAAEVLYNDDTSFMILDGRTGATRYVDGERASGTFVETPVPADIDGDGHAEILVVSQGEAPALQVYEHDGPGWCPGGPGWGSYDYAVTNAPADGYLPRHPAPWWQAFPMFRGRPSADPTFLADLRVEAGSTCAPLPEGGVAVRVTNEGTAAVASGVRVVLESGGGTLAELELPELRPGAWIDGLVLDGGGPFGQAVVLVDPEGTVNECDRSDNDLPLDGG